MSPSATREQQNLMRRLASLRPRNRDQLHHFVTTLLGLQLPRRPMLSGNVAPFAYLAHAFFADHQSPGEVKNTGGADAPPSPDCIAWANRGGGKTYLGAVATLLDLVFKPGIQVRVLGGSMQQSSRMYEHLLRCFERPMLRALLRDGPTQKRITLINGSNVEMLCQSQTSVRGQRVHKLRCDEVDEFKRPVWEAAQMITRSGWCGDTYVRGSIEALSTLHRPFGLMHDLLEEARRASWPAVFRWSAMDVIERCEPARTCDGCVLLADCSGRARHADGFMPVDDLVAQWHRCGDAVWAGEMMCRRPDTRAQVYPNFDLDRHVIDARPASPTHTQLVAATNSSFRRYPDQIGIRLSFQEADGVDAEDTLVAGMDFGLRNPMVMLWARVRGEGEQAVIEVLEEHVEEGLVLEQNLRRIEARGWPRPAWVGVDPAGGQRNSQTGCSDIELLRRRGYRVRHKRSGVIDGIKRVRRRLDRGTLFIDRHCPRLIEAMAKYHFDPDRRQNVNPVKDGPDHCCDALRYLVINLDLAGGAVKERRY